MKKKIILSLFGYFGLMGGAITLGSTVDMQPIHYLAMVLLMLGSFSIAHSTKEDE